MWDVPAVERDKFGYVCRQLLESITVAPEYDYVLIDEGQDLPEHFFRLCFHLAAGDRDRKNIVWAYDELQNIFDVKVRTPKELFGVDENNEPLIDLERASADLPGYLTNDIVLHRSYRNPKEILICAHALGFALYGEQIVQMLENRGHWEDVGYQVIEGDFTTGSLTKILRPDENSPLGLARFEPKDSIVKWLAANDYASEIGWIVEEICSFIGEGLRPEDILVISLDDRNARKYFADLAERLNAKGVRTNNVLDNPYTSSQFAAEKEVTLSTVHRAKGNEAAAVIAIGIDALYPNRKSRVARNRIFTAFTRTKAWLRVSGSGVAAQPFLSELEAALEKSPLLEFRFPDLQQVQLLQRDLSEKNAQIARVLQRTWHDLENMGLSEEEILEHLRGGTPK
jgi:superfamily I DNA and RNA helicase